MSLWTRLVEFADDAGKPVGLLAALIGLSGSAFVGFQYFQQSRYIDLTGYWRLVDTFDLSDGNRLVIEFLVRFEKDQDTSYYVGTGQKTCVNGAGALSSERSRIEIKAVPAKDTVIATFEEKLRPHQPVEGDFVWNLSGEGILEGEISSNDGSRGHSLLLPQAKKDGSCQQTNT